MIDATFLQTEEIYAMKKNLDGAKSTIRLLEGLAEIGLMTVLYYLFWRYGYEHANFPEYLGKGKYVLAGVYALLMMALFYGMDGFQFGYLKMTDVLVSQILAVFMANFFTYWQLCLMANTVISPVPMLLLLAAEGVVILLCTLLYNSIYHNLYMPKNMVMIFGTDKAISLKFKMESRQDKYRISRLISEKRGMEYICREIVNYDAVIINDIHAQMRNDILKFCYQNEIRAYVAPKLTDIILRGATDISLFDTPLLLVRSRGLTTPQRFFKRLMDLVLCLIAMIPAAPVMLLVAIAIKLEDRGPVFYKQERLTKDARPFRILKFRSMIVDAEKQVGAVLATERDPRITKVGRVIRATRLDELPQILNILKGDMSIVGPRPERKSFVDEFCRETPEFIYRNKVKGGLTGYAQIYGKYNTTPYDKLRLDMMYIENYSLLLDIKLVLMTVRIMLKRDSTEGVDKLEELERLKEEELRKLEEEESVGSV